MNAYGSNFALYEVATKALLWKDNKILLVILPNGKYDFPGGRMDKSETKLDIFDVLTREISEELSSNVKFSVRDFAFMSKRYYKSNAVEHNILALFFNTDYLSGDIKLSDEHIGFKWIYPKAILTTPKNFVTNDEYIQYKKYIS